MFKLKTSLALAAISLFVGGANAADVESLVNEQWTGAYVGVHGGYADLDFYNGWCANTKDDEEDSDICVDQVSELGGPSALWGGQLGYNKQFSSVVFGIEADVSQVFTNSHTAYYEEENDNIDSSLDAELDVNVMSSVRARLGYAMDDLLVYATGGVGYIDGDFGAETDDSNPLQMVSVSSWVPVAGAGVEFMVHEHASIKLEGLYYFESEAVDVEDLGDGHEGTNDLGNEVKFNSVTTVRVGLNYHF